MTYIRIQCSRCGYVHKESIYGYVEDPIGIPFTMCPRCKKIHKDTKHKEWIQMSLLKKYFSISPRGNYIALFLALVPMMLICVFSDVPGPSFFPFLIFSYIMCQYIIVTIRVNSRGFRKKIAASIGRTRNKQYAQILSEHGAFYGEGIPPFIIFPTQSQNLLNIEIMSMIKDDIRIPDFSESITNC